MSEVDKDKEKLGIRVEYVREKCIVVVKGSANFWLGQEGTKKNGADGGALPDSEDSETEPCRLVICSDVLQGFDRGCDPFVEALAAPSCTTLHHAAPVERFCTL